MSPDSVPLVDDPVAECVVSLLRLLLLLLLILLLFLESRCLIGEVHRISRLLLQRIVCLLRPQNALLLYCSALRLVFSAGAEQRELLLA